MTNPYEEPQRVYITDPSGAFLGDNRFSYDNAKTRVNFPFTPTLSINTDAAYGGYDLTHTNYQQRIFERGNNAEISLIAPILIRNEEEGLSVLKMADFFRAAMKMSFGENDPNRGLPPPILHLNAYNVYTNVPVVVTAFTWNFENDVDYVEINNPSATRSSQKKQYLPVSSTFVMALSTTYSPKNVRQQFNLQDYATGKLRNKGYI